MSATAIHVRFARPVDPDDALASLVARGLRAAADPELPEIEVDCGSGDEERVLRETSHALDEWLLERRLPFTVVSGDGRTLIVRPPAD